MRNLLLTFLWSLLVLPAAGQIQNHVLEQPDVPFIIDSFESSSEERDTTYPERIEYEVEGRNIGNAGIVAVQIGLVSFTPFDRLVQFGEWTSVGQIKPAHAGGTPHSISVYFPTSDAHAHFRGIVYVRKVRIENDRIWRASPDTIQKQIRSLVDKPDLSLPPDSIESAKRRKSI